MKKGCFGSMREYVYGSSMAHLVPVWSPVASVNAGWFSIEDSVQSRWVEKCDVDKLEVPEMAQQYCGQGDAMLSAEGDGPKLWQSDIGWICHPAAFGSR